MTVFHLNKYFSLCLIMLASCNDNSIKDMSVVDVVSETKPGTDSPSSNKKNHHLGKLYVHGEPFEIITFNRDITLEYTGPHDTATCKNWIIQKEDLPGIFENSEPIDGTVWDLAFAFTTCVAEGQLRQKGQLFGYSVNAGSWFRITCRDTSLLFGDFSKKDRKYFLESFTQD